MLKIVSTQQERERSNMQNRLKTIFNHIDKYMYVATDILKTKISRKKYWSAHHNGLEQMQFIKLD